MIRAQLSSDGDVLATEVRDSSGYPLLDQAAELAVQKWRFKPASRDGKRVLAIVDLPVHFKLN
jgi:protein TonB